MSVKLREKQLSSGQVSFYLDIYHNKARWYEFLNIHINRKKPSNEDKDKRRLAREIRSQREHELIVQDNGLIDKKKKLSNFITYCEKLWDIRYDENEKLVSFKNNLYASAVYNMKQYAGKQPLTFTRVTMQWMKEFEKHLLRKVANNTALNYLKVINTALNQAVRDKIIPSNPWHEVPLHQRLKKQEIFRTAFSIEQLQQLSDADCNINEQIKQAYFFSCFSGLRWSDVNPLRWDEIIVKEIEEDKKKVERWFMYFEQEKTEGIEYLPLSEQAIDILKERKRKQAEEGDQSPYVFPEIKECEGKHQLVHRKVNYALKKWAKAAGLNPKDIHFHSGRHTFATNTLESSGEADLWTVSKLLGHKSILSTQIYAHVRDKKKAAAVAALPKLKLKVAHSKAA
jgi:integrase